MCTHTRMFTQEQLSALVQRGIDTIEYPTLAPTLYDPVRYTLQSGGKRLRPMLVLMAANLFTEDLSAAITPAIGLEMYHNFTLLHDDVMDKAPDRRGRPTVHVKWDDNTAILSGDAMQALAYRLIATAPSYCLKEVIDLFTDTNIEIDEGQQMDMEFETRDDVTVGEYLEMIRLKTSVLLGCALKMGALIGKATPEQAQTLYEFGQNIGIAFQLQDDWLDCWGDPKTFGKRIGGDILCNKKTFLRIKAEQKMSLPTIEANIQATDTLSEAEVRIAQEQKISTFKEYYISSGAEQACRDAIAHYHELGIAALARLEGIPEEKLVLLKSFAAKLEKRNV